MNLEIGDIVVMDYELNGLFGVAPELGVVGGCGANYMTLLVNWLDRPDRSDEVFARYLWLYDRAL